MGEGETGRKKKEKEDEVEEPDRRKRGRRVELMEEEEELKEEGGMAGAGAQRTSSTLDLQATPPPPFKGRVHSRQGSQENGIGSAVPNHQFLGGLDKGFLSCPSVSPPGIEEIGPIDP